MATVRKITPRPGMKGRVEYITAGEADGWPRGLDVRIVGQTGQMVTARDEMGRERDFPHWEINVGFQYEYDGRWLHESHPRVLADTAELIRTQRQQQPSSSALDRDRIETIRNCEELLNRYGR